MVYKPEQLTNIKLTLLQYLKRQATHWRIDDFVKRKQISTVFGWCIIDYGAFTNCVCHKNRAISDVKMITDYLCEYISYRALVHRRANVEDVGSSMDQSLAIGTPTHLPRDIHT